MSEKLNKVLEYEKRLIQDRLQLVELLKELKNSDDELVRYKLECFQREIACMDRQVEILKQEACDEAAIMPTRQSVASQGVQQSAAAQGAMQATYGRAMSQQGAMQAVSGQAAYGRAMSQQGTAGQSAAAQGTTQAPFGQGMYSSRAAGQGKRMQSVAPTETDLEKTVGKSLMGIFASVLIFISLILFATLLLPYFNDTAKMVTTYVVSFAFLGVGMLKLKKEKDNKFYMALTGCGIGALYISLLLSNIYFKVLDDIPLYVLICLWGIGVCLYAKRQSIIFRVIGELGITISVLFGCILSINNEDATKMLALIIFYIVSSGVFYMVHFEKEFMDNMVHHIFNVINVFALAPSTLYIVGHGPEHIENWFALAVIVLGIGSTLWHTLEKESVSYGVFAVAYVYSLYEMLDDMIPDAKVFSVVIYVVMLALWGLYEWKKADRAEGKYIAQAFLLAFAGIAVMGNGDLYYYGTVPLLILPALVVGFLRKNPVCKYGSLVLLFLYTFETHAYTQMPHFWLEAIALAAGFALLWWKKDQYSLVFKNCLHALTLLFLFICTSDVMHEILASENGYNHDLPGLFNYMVFTLFNMGMMKSVFSKNLATGEKENPVVYNIANMLAMIVGTVMIVDGQEGFWQILLIVTVLGAFMLNAKNLLEKRDNIWAGIYVGVKFTLLLIVILDSFDSANYVISIACLLLAIAGIVLGFVGQYKSLRVFGLLLSMISIFKLIMVDISYDNTLGHALSFFISGILCFVISLIYNYIDNKLRERA